MAEIQPDQFYTGLVAELYTPLKSTSFGPDRYCELIDANGQPALELGCGDGDPLLDISAAGYDVDGLDSSADMIARLHRRAEAAGLTVYADVASMETFIARRPYRTIYLAGPTFNLLPDDDHMIRALSRIREALADDGTAVIPLFVPDPIGDDRLGVPVRTDVPGGWIGYTITETRRDEDQQIQRSTLRYERSVDGQIESLERTWLLHWLSPDQAIDLAAAADLHVVSGPDRIDAVPRDLVLRLR